MVYLYKGVLGCNSDNTHPFALQGQSDNTDRRAPSDLRTLTDGRERVSE